MADRFDEAARKKALAAEYLNKTLKREQEIKAVLTPAQYDFFKKYKVLYVIEYRNIVSSRENYLGYLEIKLENSSDCAYVIFPDGRKPVNCKNNLVVLNFQDYNTKQFIKINMKNEFKVEN